VLAAELGRLLTLERKPLPFTNDKPKSSYWRGSILNDYPPRRWKSSTQPQGCLNYRSTCIAPTRFPLLVLVLVEIHLIEDRIRELCGKAATVSDSEAPALFAGLQALLADHSASVRYLATKTLQRVSHEPSPSKAAD
jgi:hypothetical protein